MHISVIQDIWVAEELYEKLNQFATTLIKATDSFSTQELKKTIEELKVTVFQKWYALFY